MKRKRQFLEFVLLSCLLATTCQTVHGQPCDPLLIPGDNWETQYRERGNRCEGIYRPQVAAESIEVVGVIEGEFHFTLDKDAVIEVSCPIVSDQPVHVRAVGIPLKMYYRMDAVIEPQRTLSWPLRDVIHPLKLLASEIGIFGWIGETESIYVPVLALIQGEPTPAELVIQLCLRTSVDVDVVKWRFSEVESGSYSDLSKVPWKDAEPSFYLAGKPIRIVLPSSETGELYVEVAARDQQRTSLWLKQTLRVIVRTNNEMEDEQKNQ